MRFAWIVLVSFGLTGCGGGGTTPHEEILGSQVYTSSGTGGSQYVTGVAVTLGWSDATSLPYTFLATPALTNESSGQVFDLHSGQGADVDEYVGYLTDGSDNVLLYGARALPGGSGGVAGGHESDILLNRHAALPGPDLVGATVTRISIHMTEVHVVTGDPYSYTLEGLITYYGTVP